MSSDIAPALLKDIGVMIKRIQVLSREAVALIKPQAEDIIRNAVTDEKRIERILNTLPDFAGTSEDGLILFKRLCQHYYPLNPRATAGYISAYRDIYDNGTENESEDEA